MTDDFVFDPREYPQTNSAWLAAAEPLEDGAWHSLSKLRPLMMAASDVSTKYATEILRRAVKGGVLQKKCGRNKSRYYRIHPTGARRFMELTRP